jgi:ABC-type Fe3+ transport system permease subunit
VFRVIVDIFRSRDIGGVAKAFWALFVIVVPWLGVLVYVIARGGKMHERDIEEAKAHEEALQDYIRRTAKHRQHGRRAVPSSRRCSRRV